METPLIKWLYHKNWNWRKRLTLWRGHIYVINAQVCTGVNKCREMWNIKLWCEIKAKIENKQLEWNSLNGVNNQTKNCQMWVIIWGNSMIKINLFSVQYMLSVHFFCLRGNTDLWRVKALRICGMLSVKWYPFPLFSKCVKYLSAADINMVRQMKIECLVVESWYLSEQRKEPDHPLKNTQNRITHVHRNNNNNTTQHTSDITHDLILLCDPVYPVHCVRFACYVFVVLPHLIFQPSLSFVLVSNPKMTWFMV